MGEDFKYIDGVPIFPFSPWDALRVATSGHGDAEAMPDDPRELLMRLVGHRFVDDHGHDLHANAVFIKLLSLAISSRVGA